MSAPELKSPKELAAQFEEMCADLMKTSHNLLSPIDLQLTVSISPSGCYFLSECDRKVRDAEHS